MLSFWQVPAPLGLHEDTGTGEVKLESDVVDREYVKGEGQAPAPFGRHEDTGTAELKLESDVVDREYVKGEGSLVGEDERAQRQEGERAVWETMAQGAHQQDKESAVWETMAQGAHKQDGESAVREQRAHKQDGESAVREQRAHNQDAESAVREQGAHKQDGESAVWETMAQGAHNQASRGNPRTQPPPNLQMSSIMNRITSELQLGANVVLGEPLDNETVDPSEELQADHVAPPPRRQACYFPPPRMPPPPRFLPEEAAVRIQAQYRGYAARTRETKAATRIQVPKLAKV